MKTALLLLWRDWRGGELTILVLSLILATATITSISLFVSRIQNSIMDEASHFLAADAQVRGSLPINETWLEEANARQLQSADTREFQGMLFSESGMQLARVKAVSTDYPLKGELQLTRTPFGKVDFVGNAPARGEIWLASRLFGLLDIQPGDKVQLGEATFIASAAIYKEPDSPQSFFGVAPRVIIHIDDVAQTDVVQTGSRISYTWMLAGDTQAIEDFKNWLETSIGEHHRWVGIKEGNRGIDDALTRAERFLLLAGSLCVILSGLAIATAARRYAERQSAHVALLKTFGQTPAMITRIYSYNLLVLGVLGVSFGVLLGWLLHSIMLGFVAAFLPTELQAPTLQSWLVGCISCFVALAAFAAPPLLNLRQVPPAKVLRRNVDGSTLSKMQTTAIGSVAIIGLVFWYSKNIQLTLILMLGGLLCLSGVWWLAKWLINLSRKFSGKLNKNWRLGVANLQRHKQANSVQIMIFSVLLMLLFVMTITRTGLLAQWEQQIPEEAPNHFAFNIFPDEKTALTNLFVEHNIPHQPFYPMVRGRIVRINGELMKERAENADSDMNYVRELNLTWSDTLGEDNKLTAGSWWQEHDTEQLLVSAEEEYAKGLQLELGDKLVFSIAGNEVEVTVASLRSVQWDSMNPNFFMIFNKPLLDGSTANWMTSFFLQSEQKAFLNELTRSFPTISVIELDQMLDQVRSIIHQVGLGVEFVLVLILAAGVLVLITSIQASLDVRMQESAILRTLGANKRLVTTTLLVEFGSLGLLSGLLAVVGAEATLYVLQTRTFELGWTPHYSLWLFGPLIATILIAFIGWASTRKVVLMPPLTTLRSTG